MKNNIFLALCATSIALTGCGSDLPDGEEFIENLGKYNYQMFLETKDISLKASAGSRKDVERFEKLKTAITGKEGQRMNFKCRVANTKQFSEDMDMTCYTLDHDWTANSMETRLNNSSIVLKKVKYDGKSFVKDDVLNVDANYSSIKLTDSVYFGSDFMRDRSLAKSLYGAQIYFTEAVVNLD